MNFLITAGPTREYIDPVRFISNASSGRMGYALAEAAIKAGHKVTLITTVEKSIRLRQSFFANATKDRGCAETLREVKSQKSKLQIVQVETAAEMFEAVKKHFSKCDCLIMAAAVADYAPSKKSKVKIKKSNRNLTIKLKPTVDILKWAGKHKKVKSKKVKGKKNGSKMVVGFALEDKNLRRNARKKLKEKNLDMIIANAPASIGADKTSVQIKMSGRKWQKILRTDKTTIAKKIVNLLTR
jgi:phosphopantothenoylcysteine synthetase/decarboxylase